jgi:hypothetical protein
LEVCRKVVVVFERRYKTVMKDLDESSRGWRFSLVMGGDLARLRILTRMQVIPRRDPSLKGGK